MTLTQHPLSAAFPAMSEEEFVAYRDSIRPIPGDVRKALIASPWYRDLTASQRAMYIVMWSHWPAPGSNQHKQRVRTDTHQYAAEQVQALLHRISES